MTEIVFGLDFGTTNSLAAIAVGGRVLPLTDQVTNRPHPSVIWYRGGDIVVGHDAKENMDLSEGGAPPGFVRSPKMTLRRDGPLYVDGQPISPIDAVAEVLKHIRKDAELSRGSAKGYNLCRAIMTVPVDFGGTERRSLREAAMKAGIGVVQFVHEPVSALYGYIRSLPDYGRELARLEGRSVLVFDWGGGTLDLTLCRIRGGAIMQVINLGDNEVGGDRFDERLRNLIRTKHAVAHGIDDVSGVEQPGMAAKLLHQSELAKIRLSDPSSETASVIIRNYLKAPGAAANLVAKITKAELESESRDIVARGLAHVDELLERAALSHRDVEICLATGGMVNMPAIRDGLTERFLGRVPRLPNGDSIIAEGAAWIANDGLRLTLSKPIEILCADTSGRGIYYPLVSAGWRLPVENETQNVTNTRLFCTDPREGVAVVELAKPLKVGAPSPTDPRTTLCIATVGVDPKASPLLERIECNLQIDHDYIAKVTLRSMGRRDEQVVDFHDLDFGLALPIAENADPSDRTGPKDGDGSGPRGMAVPKQTANLVQRTNIAVDENGARQEDPWRLVPGDIVSKWRPGHFDIRGTEASGLQEHERLFYSPCSLCGRNLSQIRAEGPVEQCKRGHCGF